MMKSFKSQVAAWTAGVIGAAVFGTPTSAHALPLLSQNAAQNVSSALTLYPDHENPNLFYFMPNSSAFAKDEKTGLPVFGLTYWGLSNGGPLADAGAYMVFSLRLQSDSDQKAALQAAIASGKKIAVLPVMKSIVGLSTTKPGGAPPLGRLFDEFNFSRAAGTAEAEVAVNSVMTGVGAKVMRSMIETEAALKIDYCYTVQGLGPDFDAKVEVDWSRVYEDFQFHASGGWWWTRFQIDKQVEKLKQDNAVRIEINGGTAADEEYVKSVADKIVARLFNPELSMTPTGSLPLEAGWSFSRFQLKFTDKSELKKEVFTIKRRDMVEREFCVPMTLKDIASYKDKLVKDADKY